MSPQNTITILFFSLTLLAPAHAQQMSDAMLFEEIDTDHNGEISREESKVRADLAKNFDEADTNDNGSLSVDEYTDYHNKGRLIPEEVEIPEPGSVPIR